MLQFFRKFYMSRIGRNMLITMLVIVIPLLSVNLLIVNWSKVNIKETVTQNYSNVLYLATDQIAGKLTNLQQYAMAFSVDDEVNKMCIAESDKQVLFNFSQLRARLRSFINQQKDHCDILTYFPKQGWLVSNDVIQSMKSKEAKTAMLTRGKMETDWGICSSVLNEDEECLSMTMGYVHDNQNNPLFTIELKRETILSMLRRMSVSNGIMDAFVLDPGGSMILSKAGWCDEVEVARQLSEGMAELDRTQTHQIMVRANGKNYPIIVRALSGSRCMIGLVINEKEAFQAQSVVTLWSFVAITAFLTAVFLYMYLSYRQIVRPITNLQAAMEKVGRGDFSEAGGHYSDNEIGDIAESLNQMIRELQKTVDEKYVSEAQLAQTQMKLLRAQINPHFLYNCLFSLYTLIKNEDLDEAADLTIYLGKYYQLNTHTGEKDTQLYQELECIRMLVKIQNLRSAIHLEYSEDIDDSLKLLTIPRLTLLTVVENFLTHGFKSSSSTAKLIVTARRRKGWISLIVSDTGSGVDDDQLQEIRHLIETARPEMENVRGLQNALLRFRAIYGPEVVMSVETNEPHGLVVHIDIPDKKEA